MNVRHTNINSLYIDVLKWLMADTEEVGTIRSSPRGMPIVETLGAVVSLEDPLRCAISLPLRKLNYHFMVAEWWWICSGDDRVESIAPYCDEIKKFSDDGKTFFGAYGPRWRDQVERVIALLKTDRDSRQAVVSTWRTNDLWARWMEAFVGGERWAAWTKDVPCTLTMQYLIRDGMLNTIVTMRSWDAWLGLPYDLFNFCMLASCVAAELSVYPGTVTVQAGSLHLYDRNREAAQKLIDSGPHYTHSPPLVPVPTQLIDVQSMRALEGGARAGHIGTTREPWVRFMEVLADRKRKDPHLMREPFRTLIHGDVFGEQP